MSGLLNTTLDGSTSNLSDSTARPFTTSFSGQSAATPGFHHSGGLQGLHNIHGNFNHPSMAGSLASRNVSMSGVPSGGIQQAGGSISSGRFASNNLPAALSQMSHGSGVTNRGGINVVGSPVFSSSMNSIAGSLSGISSNSASGNRNSVPGLRMSPILGNAGPRLSSSINNMVGSGNFGRSITSGGLSVPNLASRVNITANNGAGSINVQGPNRLMTGMMQQAPQMIGMLGNLYATSVGPLSQSQVQGGNNALSSMGMINDMNANDTSPFDMNDFPQLSSRPSSSGGPQGQLGSMRKQGVGVSSIVQQNQEFSIQNEDFPALPGYKGGSTDFSVDLRQKELHDNISMMQSQHFTMARSTGFNLGGTYPSNRQQQQQHATAISGNGLNFAPGNNQDLLPMHGSDLYPSLHGSYHSQIQNSGGPGTGLRPLSSPSSASGLGAYEQLIQQYQHQNQSQFRLQQMPSVAQSYRDQNLKSMQGIPTTLDRFGMLGLLSVIRMGDPDLTSLALGIDLTTLGLSLNSSENLHKTFVSPWADQHSKEEPEYSIPNCYYSNPPPPIHQGHFSKFQLSTLFYIFYSMPKDEMQLYAASELYTRGWLYHKEHKLWFTRVANIEPLVKTNTYERGSYLCFDPNTWDTVPKENFVLHYDQVEKKPTVPSAQQ